MPLKYIREFIQLESSAGIVLFLTALLAIIVDNTAFAHYYDTFFHATVSLTISTVIIAKPMLFWVNEGFMSLFFLLVGMEIKREMLEGELNSIKKAALPAIAAVGGMLFPAAIYLFLNRHNGLALRGWAIPTATDIAFSLAVLSLLGKKISPGLKTFLMALAIFDDIGAIIIVAFFYTSHISGILLLCALLLTLVLFMLNYFNVQELSVYCVVGFLLWLCVLNSGVHATVAGVILSWMIPLKNPNNETKSPLRLLEYKIHPWVAWGVLPLFAFANAGVSFSGLTWQHLLTPVPMGIVLGLFLGKQVGIWGSTMMAVRYRIATLPKTVTGLNLYGLSLVAGIGFTMSLFIGTLAFDATESYMSLVRMGVIAGSFLSGILGYCLLRWTR